MFVKELWESFKTFFVEEGAIRGLEDPASYSMPVLASILLLKCL